MIKKEDDEKSTGIEKKAHPETLKEITIESLKVIWTMFQYVWVICEYIVVGTVKFVFSFFEHLEGKVIKEKVLENEEKKSKIAEKLAKKKDSIFIGKIGSEAVYVEQSDRACVIGPPGTGKTTFLINQVYRWMETENSFVCLDIKPEIYDITKENLEKAGYKCIVYNPTNVQDKYNFLGDLKTPEAIGEIASAFIQSDDTTPVFGETARDLLDAIIKHLKAPTKKNPKPTPTLADVYDFIVSYDSIKSLLAVLSGSNSKDCKAIARTLKIMADNDRLLGSIFATFVSNMRFLRYESIRESLSSGGFSLDELLKPKVALFVQFEEAHKETTSKLFSVMIGHILRYMITNFNNRGTVFLMLDEIGNAGVVTDLTGKLNTIRSRNLPTWLYWQSTEQMQRYGVKANEGSNIILGACDLHMCFRLNDNASADYFSAKIGTQRVEKISYNSEGATSNSDLESIIEPHEIQQLEMGVALYSYRGNNWIGEATPYYKEGELIKADDV